MNEALQFVLVFSLGVIIGASWSWHLWLKRETPVIKGAQITANFIIDPATLDNLNMAIINSWLESRGLTWQPKGAVFDPHKELKK